MSIRRKAPTTRPKRSSSHPDTRNIPDQISEIWLPEKEKIKYFEVVREIGKGGLARVHLVKRISDGQRFAMKTLLRFEQHRSEGRRNFLRELRTWMDVPEHPNLVSCWFYRTIKGHLAIFSDYIAGGSLKDWIHRKKILTIYEVLDVAIQIAWGLHAAHNRGVLHQDIKPDNILMTPDGIPKVTDFGMSSAIRKPTDLPNTENDDTYQIISTKGMTPAYCSPEQMEFSKLSYKSDIWSWGLTVLEMFTGEVTWLYGSGAALVLDSYVKKGPKDPYPVMPKELQDILRKCFQVSPRDRWDSLDEIARKLQGLFSRIFHEQYPRVQPVTGTGVSASEREFLKKKRGDNLWEDPLVWIKKVQDLGSRTIENVYTQINKGTGSRKAQNIIDLELYEEVLEAYSELNKSSDDDHEPDIAELLAEKALIHRCTDDLPGAVTTFEKAIEILETSGYADSKKETRAKCRLASMYSQKAITLRYFMSHIDAIVSHDKAIGLLEDLIADGAGIEPYDDLARAYIMKANTLWVLKDFTHALVLHDKAIEIFEKLLNQDETVSLQRALAKSYANKAVALRATGNFEDALFFNKQAIQIIEKIVDPDDQVENAKFIYSIHINNANVLSQTNNLDAALAVYDKTILELNNLMKNEGKSELDEMLANAYGNRGNCLYLLSDYHGSLESYSNAIQRFEARVIKEDRKEFAVMLAMYYRNKAIVLNVLDEAETALEFIEKSIDILENLVNIEGRQELIFDLIRIYETKTDALMAVKSYEIAVLFFDKANELLEQMIEQSQKPDLKVQLNLNKSRLAVALSALGDTSGAESLANESLKFLQSEFERTGQTELEDAILLLEKTFGHRMKHP